MKGEPRDIETIGDLMVSALIEIPIIAVSKLTSGPEGQDGHRLRLGRRAIGRRGEGCRRAQQHQHASLYAQVITDDEEEVGDLFSFAAA